MAIACLEFHIEVLQSLLQLLSSRFEYQRENSKVEYTYGWYSASAGNNDMQDIITKVKL
jgi:hypothetical protein